MMRGLTPALWAVALLLAGCSDPRSAGTSTETENAVTSVSFSIDSVLAGVPSRDGAATVATLRLDTTRFPVAATRRDGADLDVVRADGTPVPFEIVRWDPISGSGRLRVRIEASWRGSFSRILVRSGLPPAPRQSPAEVWRGIADSSRKAWTSIAVDDFESGNLLRNLLPDSSFWFLGGALPASGIAPAGPPRQGSALRLVCAAGQCSGRRAVLAATLLSRTGRDFRSLDSLEMWVKGSGRVWIALEFLDSLQSARLARGRLDSLEPRRAWTSRVLDSSWRRVAVGPSDFDPPDGQSGNVGWAALGDSVNYLSVLLEDGAEVWIDDPRLHGILGSDLR